MATMNDFAGNTYLLTLSAAETINLYSMNFSTGEVTSAYFDQAGRIALNQALYPLVSLLSGVEQSAGATALLLSSVTVSPINGNVSITSSSAGSVYTLSVAAIAAVQCRVTIAHSVQGGYVGGVSQGTSSGIAPTYNLQSFASSGTWVKPAGVQNVKVLLIGSGCGGGSGRSGAALSNRFGGGGGTSGYINLVDFRAQDLASTVTVTIGAGGTGGAGVVNADGNPGTFGGKTSFGTYLFDSNPNGFGRGGTAASGIAGTVTAGLGYNGGYPPISGAAAGGAAGFFGVGLQAGNSGGGGNITSTDTRVIAATGRSAAFQFRNIDPAGAGDGGAGGNQGLIGGDPGPATVPSILAPFAVAIRSGGGGGGAGDTAGLVNGGPGWSAGATDYGVSGGGGGAATNPATSGAGGSGGPGYVAVLSW
jgi:hypothetical protein